MEGAPPQAGGIITDGTEKRGQRQAREAVPGRDGTGSAMEKEPDSPKEPSTRAEPGGEPALPSASGAASSPDTGDTRPPTDALRSDSVQSLLATQITDPLDALIRASRYRPSPGTRLGVPEQKPPTILGDFRLTRKLGEGAMGVVYKANQISVEREVAVKVLFPHMAKNAKFLERFYREGRVMGRLEHPNIVRAYAVDEFEGWHYFAMEYIDGRSLQKWLTLLGRLSVGDALCIILRCAEALSYAHAIEVVHRDIKPDNILITRAGEVKLADFGAVKLLDEDISLTQTGNGIGTPCYMPLEQARNAKETDGRSDIYALGCVLYCMLTGRPPYLGANLVELIQAKEAAHFTPARRLNPEVPERLDLIIDKMVAKALKYRYASCAEVIRDLTALRRANASLTFIPLGSTAEMTPVREATPEPQPPRVAPLPPPSAEPVSGDWWYVMLRSGQGFVTRKMTTAEVHELVKSKDFDPLTMASRTLNEGYRTLARYREFEHLVGSRVTKSAADLRATRFRNQYHQLEEASLERHANADAESETASEPSGDWLVLLYKIALIAIASGFLWVAVRMMWHALAEFRGG